MYDPHAHAESMRIHVEYHPLKTALGLWIPERQSIFIKPGLSGLMERSVLAHELVHLEFNDPPGHNPRYEHRANRIAAQRLIDPRAFKQLIRIYPVGDHLCHELGVSRELLIEYLKAA